LDDEVKNNDETPESPEEEAARVKTRAAELEKTLAEKDAEIGILKKTGAEMEAKYKSLGDTLTGAVTGYRNIMVKTNPEIPEEMISGETIEAINKSVERAKTLVSRIRQGIEAEMTKVKVPAGAPERNAPDLSALTPGEKIRYALGGNE
jgi:hypothetical protein